MKEVPVKVTGSPYTAVEFTEGVSQESQNLVLNSGQTLDETNLHQMTQSVCRFGSSKFQYLDNGSTVNTYVVRSYIQIFDSNSFITQYFNGMTVTFKVPITNTGPSTLNVDGLGAVPIVNESSGPLDAERLSVPFYVTVVYSNNTFIIQKEVGADVILRNILQGTGGAAYVNSATGANVEARLNALENEINTINSFPRVQGYGAVQNGSIINQLNIATLGRNDVGGAQRWFLQTTTPILNVIGNNLIGSNVGNQFVSEIINTTERWIFPGLANTAGNASFQFIWV